MRFLINHCGSLLQLVLRWREDLKFGKVRLKPRCVSRKQCQMFNRRLRTNVEIRHRGVSGASASAIDKEALAGQKPRLPWQGFPLVDVTRECRVQRFDGRIADGNFGVDDRIDNQCRVLGTF